MAYAAYRESFGANRCDALSGAQGHGRQLAVLEFTVPSRDAFAVRRLLASYPDTGVVRCVPRPQDNLVRLEIQMPACRVPELMHVLINALPCGEVGALNSWRRHLTGHGLTHGF